MESLAIFPYPAFLSQLSLDCELEIGDPGKEIPKEGKEVKVDNHQDEMYENCDSRVWRDV
jgi:hypothetical protein